MKSLLVFVLATALLLEQCSSSVRVQQGKLGQTITLMFGSGVTDVQAAISDPPVGEPDRKHIVKDGKITDYGHQRYGDRLSFKDGKLTIQSVTRDDAVSYFFFIGGDPRKPGAIDLEIE